MDRGERVSLVTVAADDHHREAARRSRQQRLPEDGRVTDVDLVRRRDHNETVLLGDGKNRLWHGSLPGKRMSVARIVVTAAG